MPSVPGDVIRNVVEIARKARIPYRIIPGVYEILSGKVTISSIRDVNVEDLLRREPVRLNLDDIADYLKNRVVLVTGAGGSIGSEIVRQVLGFEPKQVILVDRDENNLYMLEKTLERDHPDLDLKPVIMSTQRRSKLDAIFNAYRPDVVFHTAAYKHVPLMERSPDEAILNNVVSTKNLVEMALKYSVQRFVNISTDKAVRPTSVMGASKRVVEMIVEHAAMQAQPGQCFVSVRFGNVLGSNGSVVPIFNEQIRKGGPITITHEDMTRYFMSIPEATQLVLQAGGLTENRVVYILDMGEPVKIVDLATDLIRLSGLDPESIPIKYTGIRPGEKLYEELMIGDQGTTITQYEKIYALHKNGKHGDRFDDQLAELLEAANTCNGDRIRRLLKEMVPTYQPMDCSTQE